MTRGRAVLDTNLFYYATGVFSDQQLRENWLDILKESHDLFISSPSIVEVLTNSNLQPDERWDCLDAMFSGQYSDIVQIGCLPFDTTALQQVTSFRDTNGLDHIRQEALGGGSGARRTFFGSSSWYYLAHSYTYYLWTDRTT